MVAGGTHGYAKVVRFGGRSGSAFDQASASFGMSAFTKTFRKQVGLADAGLGESHRDSTYASALLTQTVRCCLLLGVLT